MALLPPLLAASILRIQTTKPSSAVDAAGAWADAYNDYARAATAGAFPAVLVGTEKELFRIAILPMFQSPRSATAATMAAAFYQGVVQFWSTPPVLFGVNPVTVPPLPILIPQLTAIFSNNNQPAESAALQVALAFHACTITTQVLVTPPGSLFPLL